MAHHHLSREPARGRRRGGGAHTPQDRSAGLGKVQSRGSLVFLHSSERERERERERESFIRNYAYRGEKGERQQGQHTHTQRRPVFRHSLESTLGVCVALAVLGVCVALAVCLSCCLSPCPGPCAELCVSRTLCVAREGVSERSE